MGRLPGGYGDQYQEGGNGGAAASRLDYLRKYKKSPQRRAESDRMRSYGAVALPIPGDFVMDLAAARRVLRRKTLELASAPICTRGDVARKPMPSSSDTSTLPFRRISSARRMARSCDDQFPPRRKRGPVRSAREYRLAGRKSTRASQPGIFRNRWAATNGTEPCIAGEAQLPGARCIRG